MTVSKDDIIRAEDDDVFGIGIVDDGDTVAGHQCRCRSGSDALLPRLEDPIVFVFLAPGHPGGAIGLGVEAIQRCGRHDVDAAVLIHGEGVCDLLAIDDDVADNSGLRIDIADDTRLRGKPNPAAEIRQRRLDGIRVVHGHGDVEVLHLHKAAVPSRTAHGVHHDVVRGRRDDGTVSMVEIEVAARKLGVVTCCDRWVGDFGGRQRQTRQHLECVGMDERQLGRHRPCDAHRDKPAATVEGNARALSPRHSRRHLRIATDGARPAVGVSQIGVVVDVARAVGRHVGVGRHRRQRHRLRLRHLADEFHSTVVTPAIGDRSRVAAGRRTSRSKCDQAEQGCRGAGKSDGHGAHGDTVCLCPPGTNTDRPADPRCRYDTSGSRHPTPDRASWAQPHVGQDACDNAHVLSHEFDTTHSPCVAARQVTPVIDVNSPMRVVAR